jgi:stage IV sporulation protein FB
VFFGIPSETPLDLRFWLFGVHVRVHPLHWVFSAVLGWSFFVNRGGSLLYLALWVACVFVSVLIHEMGHVVMGRLFGSEGHIVLFSLGGVAIGAADLRHRWQRILVSFAGPLIQLALWGLVYGAARTLAPQALANSQKPLSQQNPLDVLIGMLLFINLVWPLFNLLPIWPLDGGKITREVLEGLFGHRGVIASLWVSIILSGALALQMLLAANNIKLIPYLGWLPADLYLGLFFAVFCFGSIQALQAERNRSRWEDELPWER